MISDRLFVTGIVKAAQMHARLYTSPVYLYQFGYRGRHSLSELFAKSNENYGDENIVVVIIIMIVHRKINRGRAQRGEGDEDVVSSLFPITISFNVSRRTVHEFSNRYRQNISCFFHRTLYNHRLTYVLDDMFSIV